jgi:hypothetical protein
MHQILNPYYKTKLYDNETPFGAYLGFNSNEYTIITLSLLSFDINKHNDEYIFIDLKRSDNNIIHSESIRLTVDRV